MLTLLSIFKSCIPLDNIQLSSRAPRSEKIISDVRTISAEWLNKNNSKYLFFPLKMKKLNFEESTDSQHTHKKISTSSENQTVIVFIKMYQAVNTHTHTHIYYIHIVHYCVSLIILSILYAIVVLLMDISSHRLYCSGKEKANDCIHQTHCHAYISLYQHTTRR